MEELYIFEDTILNSNNQYIAVWPLLWWIIGGTVAVLLGTVIFSSSETKTTVGNSIAVLGMQMSGKTTFYDMLRYGKSNASGGTHLDTIPSFEYTAPNGRCIKFAESKDIGGGEEYIKLWYEEQMKKNDIVFFFFDSYRYSKETIYKKEVNARLSYIYDMAREIGKDVDKNIVIVGSFVDKFSKSDQKNVMSNIQKDLSNKDYSALLKTNFFVVSLIEKKHIDKIISEVI